MIESVGKKLSQARQKRGVSLEEVAHITKLRPDKIVALETDDYSSFPSGAYAKGFLQIYARYLQVDVSDFLATLESSNSISVDDYQYLSNAPTPKRVEPERRDERHPPSVAPLVFTIFMVLIGVAVMWFITSYNRTVPAHASDTEDNASKPPQSASTPAHSAPAQAAPEKAQTTPKPAIASGAAPVAPPAPPPGGAPAPAPSLHASAPALPTPAPVVGPATGETSPFPPPVIPTPRTGSSVLSDRDFITPTAVVTPELTKFTSPRGGLNEVQVASVKKTWVTIRRDNPKAPPIFEDYIYPNANPLKLRGSRFFIDARDPGSVQITMNGLPFAYPDSNAPVQ